MAREKWGTETQREGEVVTQRDPEREGEAVTRRDSGREGREGVEGGGGQSGERGVSGGEREREVGRETEQGQEEAGEVTE